MSIISSWDTWAKKLFPDKNAQKMLEEMLKSEDWEKSEYPQEVFELTCVNGGKIENSSPQMLTIFTSRDYSHLWRE